MQVDHTNDVAGSGTSKPFAHDVVADLPDELAEVVLAQGGFPEGVQFEEGVYCVWDARTFVHARATLPLQAIDDGVGFGLWVEIEPEELQRYVEAVVDDEQYSQFSTEGLLANSWPGFLNTLGLPVKIETIRLSDKIYITEVQLDRLRDVLFETALLAENVADLEQIDIRGLITAWMGDAPPAEAAQIADDLEESVEVAEVQQRPMEQLERQVEQVEAFAAEPIEPEPATTEPNQPITVYENNSPVTVHDQSADLDGEPGLSQPMEQSDVAINTQDASTTEITQG